MQMESRMSSEIVIRNRVNWTLDVGGYCWSHDAHYHLAQGDEVCPRCEKWQAQDLARRDEEDVHYTSGDDMGDSDEE